MLIWQSFPFGWEDASEGFRGHVFVSSDNSTVILSIKGTTIQGPTSKKDKYNDNLLFSCCCARVDFSWIFNTVCDCYANHWRCDNTCLTTALVQDSLFYSVGVVCFSCSPAVYAATMIPSQTKSNHFRYFADPDQGPDHTLPHIQRLARRPLPWRRTRLSPRHHLRPPLRRLRSPRRTPSRKPSAPPPPSIPTLFLFRPTLRPRHPRLPQRRPDPPRRLYRLRLALRLGRIRIRDAVSSWEEYRL